MKYRFFATLLSVGVLSSSAHIGENKKRIPASLGIIGPSGDVLLYYKEGDNIIVKNCDPNTILGSTPNEAKANCQGKSNKVPVESFKQALQNLVSTDRLNILKPLTPAEVQAYNRDDPNSDQFNVMIVELDKINAFIANYGAENANLVRKEELLQALRSSETRVNAIKKINAEIEKAVNLISSQTKLAFTKFNSDKDQFLYTTLKNFNPADKSPCGLSGSIDERIKNCSYQVSSTVLGFSLVTRTKEFKEVHQENKTGLLWGDRLSTTMNYDDALESCKGDLDEVAKFGNLTWRLPSIEEYVTAEKEGIRKALPNMNYLWWSSSLSDFADYEVLVYSYSGSVHDDYRDGVYSVRCVAQLVW